MEVSFGSKKERVREEMSRLASGRPRSDLQVQGRIHPMSMSHNRIQSPMMHPLQKLGFRSRKALKHQHDFA